MTDQTAYMASQIIADGRFIDAIRYMRRDGMPFVVARKYAQEIRDGAPWWKRAAKRGRKAR